MAFQKTIQCPNGYAATYIKLADQSINPLRREAKTKFFFYKDKATADDPKGATVCTQIATLDLARESFDRWFSKAAKDAAAEAGLSLDSSAIFYRAARAENIVCDFGAIKYLPKKNPADETEALRPTGYRDLFSDAIDV